MPLTPLPLRQDPRPGTGDDQHVTYYCATCGGWYPAGHKCSGGDAR